MAFLMQSADKDDVSAVVVESIKTGQSLTLFLNFPTMASPKGF